MPDTRFGTGSLTGDGWLRALLDKCFPDFRLNRLKPLLHKDFGGLSPLKRPVPPEVGSEVHDMPGWVASTVREFEPVTEGTYDQVLVYCCCGRRATATGDRRLKTAIAPAS